MRSRSPFLGRSWRCARGMGGEERGRFIATVLREGCRFIPTFSNLGWQGEPTASDHPRK